jgi:feruloyl esterase
VDYYQSVVAKMGQRDAHSFVRLYLVPGVQHCDNGPGTDSFGQVGRLVFDDPPHSVDAALEQWVEKATAPSTIIASKYATEDRQRSTMMRPLCAYPQSAKYKGSGDPNDTASFVCEVGKK